MADRKHHGSPDQAVCCQPIEHYDFWNDEYPDAALGPASVGENWTISGGNEQTVCVGDVYQVGSARVQVSASRGSLQEAGAQAAAAGIFEARSGDTANGMVPAGADAGRGGRGG